MTGTGGLMMNYQEAIELLKGEIKCSCYRNRGYCGICTIYSELDRDKIIDACKCAISAIQELQEYQKIGTLEEMKMLKATHFSGIELAKISCRLKQLEKYVDIGTLEEVREAVEKHKWIPCSERLPEESGKYEVTALDAGRLIVTQVKWQPKLKSWNLTGAMAYWKITAWKPLPEPYNPDKCHGCFGAANNDCERCSG